jgi:hypothetical protein
MEADNREHIETLKKKVIELINSTHNGKINKTNIGKAVNAIADTVPKENSEIFEKLVPIAKKELYVQYLPANEQPKEKGAGKAAPVATKKKKGLEPSHEEVVRVVMWFMSQMSQLKHEQ